MTPIHFGKIRNEKIRFSSILSYPNRITMSTANEEREKAVESYYYKFVRRKKTRRQSKYLNRDEGITLCTSSLTLII